jgi:hypothetical protein
MNKWHCAIDGTKYGPVSAQDLHQWLAEGRLKPTDQVWTEGMVDWVPFNTVEELNSGVAPQPYAPAPMRTAPQQGNGMAVAGMVLGIVSLVLICIWFLSPICAIVGLCLSVVGKKRAEETNTGKGMAIAGIVLSCVTLALLIIGLIAVLMGLGIMGHLLQNMPKHQ